MVTVGYNKRIVTIFLVLCCSIYYINNKPDNVAQSLSCTKLRSVSMHDNNTLSLPLDAYERSYNPGDSCRTNNVFHRLNSGQHVDIAFIGGSMTAGHGCKPRKCSWPGMFNKWLHTNFPWWNVTVVNMAKGGYSSYVWLTRKQFSDLKVDLVVLDFSVNSAAEPAELVESVLGQIIHSLYMRNIAVISMETFDACGTNELHCKQSCKNSTVGGKNGYYWCESWWELQDRDYEALKYYNTPFSSYRDAVWPDKKKPPDNIAEYWSDHHHPGYATHQLVAKVFEYTFMQKLQEYCNHPGFQTCPEPRNPLVNTFYCTGHTDFAQFRPVSMHNSWTFYEDSPGKPGWINTDNGTGDIVFKANLGTKRQLEVTYLRTYSTEGAVKVYVECDDSDWLYAGMLKTYWGVRTSVPYVHVYVSRKDGIHEYVPFGQTCLIKFEMAPKPDAVNKFKIISVNGC